MGHALCYPVRKGCKTYSHNSLGPKTSFDLDRHASEQFQELMF